VKVAQYEVLGIAFQSAIRPGWDDRRMPATAELHARPKIERFLSSLPGRTCPWCFISQHFVLGYFQRVPPGQVLTRNPKPLKLIHMGNCRDRLPAEPISKPDKPYPGLIFSILATLILYKSFVALDWHDNKIIA